MNCARHAVTGDGANYCGLRMLTRASGHHTLPAAVLYFNSVVLKQRSSWLNPSIRRRKAWRLSVAPSAEDASAKLEFTISVGAQTQRCLIR